MYDGLDKIPIGKMNFKQLRERVQILQDRYEVLIRRYPELSATGAAASGEGIDWANIITPLIHATVNRIQFTASQNYEDLIDLEDGPPGIHEDKNLIYRFDGLYWYWNGNEWTSTTERNIHSVFQQTPAGFSLKGILEIMTDTGGRLTISDSFIKMYPAGTDDPKIQFGYYNDTTDPDNPINNPIIVLGIGSSTETVPICGYPVRYGQAILLKTATSVIVGMVSESGVAKSFELRAEGDAPWCYYTDGAAEMRIAMQTEIDQLQEQINSLKAQVEGM